MTKMIKTEFVTVLIRSSENEAHQIITGNSITAIAKLAERYMKTINDYESAGYTITDRDEKGFSFTASKKVEESTE